MTSRDENEQAGRGGDGSPIIVVAYPAVGDFVRCHSLVRILAQRFPRRPIDVVTRAPTIELVPFMPEVREGIAENFRHGRLDLSGRFALASELRRRGYGTAYVIPGTYKAALVPFFAGVPERIGWVTEGQWPAVNRPRFGMQRIARMVDRLCLLGIDKADVSVAAWPLPRLRVPVQMQDRFDAFQREARSNGPVVALGVGSSDPSKNWSIDHFTKVARHCVMRGCSVWVVGSRAEAKLAAAIGQHVRVTDRTMEPVSDLALSLAAADMFVGNDSGPLHVAAAFDKPCVAVFGLTDPDLVAPINPAVQIPLPDRAIAWRSRDEVRWPEPEQVIACVDRDLGRLPATRGVDDRSA